MDIIASIFAYLGSVAAVVAALAMSFSLCFSSANKPTPAKPVAGIAAKADMLKVASAPQSEPVVKTEQHGATIAATIAPASAQDATAAKKLAVADPVRRTSTLRGASLRHLVQEERARRWAYQQDSQFQARFLGYAD